MLEPLFVDPENTVVRRQPQVRKQRSKPSVSRAFEFVLSDSAGKPPAESRKFIRSYVMRGRNRKRPCNPPRPNVAWINHDVDTYREGQSGIYNDSTQTVEINEPTRPVDTSHHASHETSVTPIRHITSQASLAKRDEASRALARENVFKAARLLRPFRTPSDLSLVTFADPVDDQSRYLIQTFFASVKETMYPAEWCFEFDRSKICWFTWLLYDSAYLHSVLFMVNAFQDLLRTKAMGLGEGESLSFDFSTQTQHRLRRTIQLLQEKLEDKEQQLSDTTAAVVLTLAMMADASGDSAACEAHVAGLKRLVKLRGGLEGFKSNRQMQIKICRVDLGWSIKNGTKPEFFDEEMSWDPFLENIIKSYLPESGRINYSEVQDIVTSWDSKLRNIYADLRDFSKMANTFIPTHKRLHPELFQEMTLSFQYRLLLLQYDVDDEPLKEAARLGLLAYETSIFMQVPGVKLDSPLFDKQLRTAIERLQVSGPGTRELKLWLLFIGAIIVFNFKEPWLIESIRELTPGETWEQVRQRLKKVMWIHMVHDEPGKQAFQASRQDYTPFVPTTGNGNVMGSQRTGAFGQSLPQIPSILYRR